MALPNEWTRATPPPPPAAAAEELALGAYFQALWQRRFILIALTLIGGVLGLGFSFMQPIRYEGRVTLLMQPSKLNEDRATPKMNPTELTPMLANRALTGKLVREFGLDKPPYRLGAEALLARVRIEDVRGAPLIRVSVQLEAPQMAADVANAFARESIALNRDLNQSEAVVSRDTIWQQLEESKAKLARAENDLLTFKQSAQVEVAKKDVEAVLDQRSRLLDLQVEIASLQSALREAQTQLASQERVLPAPRDVNAEADILATSRRETRVEAAHNSRKPNDSSKIEDATREYLRNRSERMAETPTYPLSGGVMNPVRQILEYQAATFSTRIAALTEERKEIAKELKLDASHLSELNRMYQGEIEQARLELERDIASKAYAAIVGEHEEARLKVTKRSAELQIVDPALPPRGPSSPNRPAFTLLGLIGGLFIGLAISSSAYAFSLIR